MKIVKVHLIRLDDLDAATSTPPGVHARVELGDVAYLDLHQEHRISYLTYWASAVEIVATNPRILDRLAAAISEYAADQVAS